MWGVIPVAGQGSRLRSVTRGGPKCLVEVGGRPLLHHLLDQLAPLCPDICVVVPPDVAGISHALAHHPLGQRAVTVVQPTPLGLADAVEHAFPVIGPPALVAMGDTFHGGAMSNPLGFLEPGESALLVEDRPPGEGESAGWARPDAAGYARGVWKGVEPEEGARRIAGGFVLGQDAFKTLPRSGAGIGFEERIQRSIDGGARYKLIELDYPRWNVNTPEQLLELRSWYDGQAMPREHGSRAG